jgi:uncharacterized protein YbjT (DUF2867 family)
MIVVTGATGQLGSRIVRQLLGRVPADQVGVSVRDPAAAAALAGLGVRVRRGDFTEPGTLAGAFEGARQVLVVSAAIWGEAAVTANTAAVDAARAAGAERILYTSHQGSAADSLFPPMPTHAATEQHLSQSGTPFTALRNGFYAETLRRMAGPALQTGRLVAPADGPVSWTAHDDLAEATAILLTDPGRFDGPTPPLTAPQALELADVAALLSDITGRTIERVVVEEDEFIATQVANGMPAALAPLTLGMYRASARGEFAATTPDLEKIIDHPATTVRTLLERIVAEA